jgi:hypothetical protein
MKSLLNAENNQEYSVVTFKDNNGCYRAIPCRIWRNRSRKTIHFPDLISTFQMRTNTPCEAMWFLLKATESHLAKVIVQENFTDEDLSVHDIGGSELKEKLKSPPTRSPTRGGGPAAAGPGSVASFYSLGSPGAGSPLGRGATGEGEAAAPVGNTDSVDTNTQQVSATSEKQITSENATEESSPPPQKTTETPSSGPADWIFSPAPKSLPSTIFVQEEERRASVTKLPPTFRLFSSRGEPIPSHTEVQEEVDGSDKHLGQNVEQGIRFRKANEKLRKQYSVDSDQNTPRPGRSRPRTIRKNNGSTGMQRFILSSGTPVQADCFVSSVGTQIEEIRHPNPLGLRFPKAKAVAPAFAVPSESAMSDTENEYSLVSTPRQVVSIASTSSRDSSLDRVIDDMPELTPTSSTTSEERRHSRSEESICGDGTIGSMSREELNTEVEKVFQKTMVNVFAMLGEALAQKSV